MRPKILLVDDHEIVRKGIRELLEGPTLDVVGEARTGEEAILKVQDLKPDMVIMDYSMPGMNGLQALQKIKESVPATKVLILTVDDTAAENAKSAGADASVNKGSLVSDLRQTIAQILIGRRLSDGW